MSIKLFLIFAILAVCTFVVVKSNKSFYYPDEYEKTRYQSAPEGAAYAAVAPSYSPTFDRTRYEQYVDEVIARGIAKLSLAINKAYQDQIHSGNIVFAPLNIAGALALMLLGSNGKTFHELAMVLGFATGLEIESKSEKVHEQLGRIIRKIEETAGIEFGQQVTFAGALFVQNNYPIRKLYKETAEFLYQCEVLNLDFHENPTKAGQLINAWVSDRTNGKIQEILTGIPSTNTKVILASAMYFKARWETPFFDETTARRPFYPYGRTSPTSIEVEMMSNAGDFPYFKDEKLGCEVMGFPYKGNASVMYVIVPFNSNIQKLKEFETRLTERDLEYLADNTKLTTSTILFPKMKIESTLDLKGILSVLGVKTLFDPAEANLGILSPGISSPSAVLNSSDFTVNPIGPRQNPNDIIIFSRFGDTVNCSSIFDPNSNITTCQDTVDGPNGTQNVIYKKFGDKIGRRVVRDVPIDNKKNKRATTTPIDNIDRLRNLINQQSTDNHYQNPGLYADTVIHKVYMDITESGTEGAASTLVSIFKSYSRTNFRVDVPFIFFIRHEETKTIMFWGSVDTPTPNFVKSS